MRKGRGLGVLLALLTFNLEFAHADTSAGAAFLLLGGGARPLALGNAYTAARGDLDSMYYNPAGLARLARPELSFSHSDWFEGTEYDLVSYGQSTSIGTIGASALRLGGGTQDGRDVFRQQTGSFTTDDVSLMLSYGKGIGDYGALGANVKYLRSRIADTSAATVAFDLGAQARIPGQRVWLGAAALNMGSGLRFVDQVDRLPFTLAVGAAYRPVPALRLLLDVKHQPYDQMSEADAGAEYTLSVFDFRIGYNAPIQGLADQTPSPSEHIRGGFGIHFSRYRADYTLAPFGDLGLTQRFTLSLRFGDASTTDTPKNLQDPGANPISTSQSSFEK